jgi:hypothetical protein
MVVTGLHTAIVNHLTGMIAHGITAKVTGQNAGLSTGMPDHGMIAQRGHVRAEIALPTATARIVNHLIGTTAQPDHAVETAPASTAATRATVMKHHGIVPTDRLGHATVMTDQTALSAGHLTVTGAGMTSQPTVRLSAGRFPATAMMTANGDHRTVTGMPNRTGQPTQSGPVRLIATATTAHLDHAHPATRMRPPAHVLRVTGMPDHASPLAGMVVTGPIAASVNPLIGMLRVSAGPTTGTRKATRKQ